MDARNVRARDYPTDCKRDADCVAIIEGDCSVNRCANAAMHRTAFDEYRAVCSGTRDPLAECLLEVGETAFCVSGRCSAERP